MLVILTDALTRCGDAIGVDVAAFDQRLDHDWHATDLEQVFGHVLTARLQVRDVRCVTEDVADVVQVEVDATLMRDRW